VLICDIPDVRLTHGFIVPTRGETFGFAGQGFKCDVTFTKGSGVTQITMRDSVEVDQTYKTLNGLGAAAVTTACVGRLPKSSPLTSAGSFACEQNDPFGSGAVLSSGWTTVFSNREFEEICENYKYK
jgi:hypothetical protein